MMITDTPDKVEQIVNLAARLDVPELQVEIEARIIQATTNFVRELGTWFGLLLGSSGSAIQGTLNVTLPAQQPLAIAGVTIGRMLDTALLDTMLSAAESRGDVRILSRPRVSTQSNVEATITQEARIPIPVQENFTTTVRFETSALRLVVTPTVTRTVTREETIVLKIRVENNVPEFYAHGPGDTDDPDERVANRSPTPQRWNHGDRRDLPGNGTQARAEGAWLGQDSDYGGSVQEKFPAARNPGDSVFYHCQNQRNPWITFCCAINVCSKDFKT